MHILLRENLEEYLSGNLDPASRQALEAHLAACVECREEWEALRQLSEGLRSLRPPQGLEMELEPAPGFYARVVDGIGAEPEVPFWTMLLDPQFGRRVAFACLMLLAALGAYVATLQPADYPSQHRPEAVLACAGPNCQSTLPMPAPRFGPSLEHNRGAVLAALVSQGD